jgi:integrase
VFNDITLDFYFDFHTYLVNEKLSTNTIGKRIAILKTIMREATERGLNTNLSFQSKRFKVTREKTENIYLNESELMEIYKLDLSKNKKLNRVRDLFLVGCYTGLRFSDLSVLSNQNIKDNFIEIETQKTRESVAIPLHPIVRNIIDKHKGGLPRALSLQRMNIYLKKIGEMIESLNVNTSKKMTKGGLEITTNSKKYLQITTHTARRSFASNLFVKGVPSQTIMKITGHKTEKSFMQYIKITPKENAKLIQMIWDKESKLSIVS